MLTINAKDTKLMENKNHIGKLELFSNGATKYKESAVQLVNFLISHYILYKV